jgi:adenine-specific DNA glycosylase
MEEKKRIKRDELVLLNLPTPSEMSPYGYFQERYRAEPWRVLCCVIMLNVCSGKQLEKVHRLFFKLFPDPSTAAREDVTELMALVLEPLGIQNVRARRIQAMSRAYLEWDGRDVKKLPGIGRYGEESYTIFVSGVLVGNVRDKELKRYVAWALERSVPNGTDEEDIEDPRGPDGL